MALKFMDSTDHYDVFTDITAKWTANVINSTNSGLAPAGRGTRCLNVRDGIGKALPYSDKWVVGFAAYWGGNQGFGSSGIYTLSATNENTLAVLKTESDGTLSIYAGNSLNLIANSGSSATPFILVTQRWYYIEVETKLTGTTPISATMTVRVNSVTVMTGVASTGVNQSQLLLQTTQANYHTFSNSSLGGVTFMRDFYIANEDGTGTLNAFAGDISIAALFPRADVTLNWTAVGGSTATGWDHVNPQFPETNDDTIYIKDNNAGDVANFNWQPVPVFSGIIIGVHYGAYARKDDEGERTFQLSTQGTPNGPVVSPGESYQYYFFAMDADPSTGIRWTQAGFNGSAFGVTLLS